MDTYGLPVSHGDHDFRLLDAGLEEALEVDGVAMRASFSPAFDRGVVAYCPSCGTSCSCPYISELMDSSDGRERAVRQVLSMFCESFPDSCESARRLALAEEVMGA